VDPLADGLSGDPPFGQGTRASSLGREQAEDAAVGAAKSGAVGSHPARDLGPQSPLERVEGGEEVRERRIGFFVRGAGFTGELASKVVNHVDNISKSRLQRQPVRVIPSRVAQASARSTAAVATCQVSPLSHRVENMTTCRLDRVHGTLTDGAEFSVVAKTLHPASASPAFASIPHEHHAQVLEDLHWLDEPAVYGSGLGRSLPAPFRMATVHEIARHGDEHLTIWMEHVDDTEPWTLDRYRRTASALGALAGRWSEPDAVAVFGLRRRDISRLFFGKVLHHDVPIQADDSFWADPLVAAVADHRHRADLGRLVDAIPRLLDALDGVPLGVCHGDAAPDNFREPGDGSTVVLDWSYGHVGPVGSDLGQLLAGPFESGVADPDDVAPIAATILDGFLAGLEAVRSSIRPDQVRTAWATHLAIRSVVSLLILERDDLDDQRRADILVRRAALARAGLDLALEMAEA
jgi:hypothetical protein